MLNDILISTFRGITTFRTWVTGRGLEIPACSIYGGRIPTQEVEQETDTLAHPRLDGRKVWPQGFGDLELERGVLELHQCQQGAPVDGGHGGYGRQAITGWLSVALDHPDLCDSHQTPILISLTKEPYWP